LFGLMASSAAGPSLACFDINLTTWANPSEIRSPAELLAIGFAELTSRPAGR
jgi:hypothetical protein